MRTGRLEAFSDGVIAILITIMVLELDIPEEPTVHALRELWPVLLSYVLSFVNLGIYWNNHHHLFQAAKGVTGGVLWANLHLLFWLSLFPFATAWMGENDFDKVPVAAYGVTSLAAAVAYYVLQNVIVRGPGADAQFTAALGRDLKGKISPALYFAGIVLAPVNRWVSLGFYVTVALMWLVPDRRVERSLVALKRSAGLLLYRRVGTDVEVLIAHPGGPYWAKKDDGAWSIPKGEYDDDEDPWVCACREFAEEIGQPHPEGEPIDLGELRQASGKRVRCFAVEADVDITELSSNTFEMEWPPRSGVVKAFPEIDRAAWVSPDTARTKLLKGQAPFVDLLLAALTN